MTLPASGTITVLDIYNEAQLDSLSPWYDKGANLGAYRGIQWWKDNSQTGTFPTGAIAMSDFYDKRSTTPVSPGSTVYYGSGNFTVPLYSTMTVVIRGGSGGGAGQSGNAASGGSGTNGGTSYFGGYGSGDFGRGAPPGGNGAAGYGSDGSPAGGFGYGYGGASGKTTLTLTNPISGGAGPAVGSTVAITVGSKGYGGSGGAYWVTYPTVAASLPGGSSGSDGYVEIYWS